MGIAITPEGLLYNNDKHCFVTCPYNDHKNCQYSCALVQEHSNKTDAYSKHVEPFLILRCGADQRSFSLDAEVDAPEYKAVKKAMDSYKECPKCHKDDLQTVEPPLFTEDNQIEAVMQCQDCGHKWTEVYRLTEILEDA